MAQQDTMVSATTALEHSSSSQHLTKVLSRYYLTTTDIHSLPPTSTQKIFQYSLEHPYRNRELTPCSETVSSCLPLPSTDLHSGRQSFFLPLTDLGLSSRHFCHPSTALCYFGGILDSPLMRTHSFLNCETPLSPPLTLPKSTMSLPAVEDEIEGYLPSPLNQTHDLPDQDDIFNSPSPLVGALTSSSQSSFNTLNSSPSLSPISPSLSEWFSQALSPPPRLRSLGSESFGEKIGNGLFANPDCHYSNNGGLTKVELTPLHNFPAPPLSSSQAHPVNSDPFFSTTICSSPISIYQEGLDPIELGNKLFPVSLPLGEPFAEQAPVECPYKVEQTAHQPELDDLGDAYIDFPDSLVNLAPPPSPSRRGSFADLPDDDLSLPLAIQTTQNMFDDTLVLSPPESPGLTLHSLPGADTDKNLIPVESASPKRASDRLPVLQTRLLIVEDDSTLHLSTDQRSLSPEPCDTLDTNMIDSQIGGDNELKGMCGVMKRTKEREGAAKSMESILEEEERVIRSISRGKNRDVDEAWNKLMIARRKSRRLKEKVQETATLLRLMLAEKGWKTEKDEFGKSILVPKSPSLKTKGTMEIDSHPPAGPTRKRLRITNPQQLLVKMLMDRHESQFSPSGRAASPSRGTISPLGRTSISAVDLDTANGTIPDIVDIPNVETDMNLNTGFS